MRVVHFTFFIKYFVSLIGQKNHHDNSFPDKPNEKKNVHKKIGIFGLSAYLQYFSALKSTQLWRYFPSEKLREISGL